MPLLIPFFLFNQTKKSTETTIVPNEQRDKLGGFLWNKTKHDI